MSLRHDTVLLGSQTNVRIRVYKPYLRSRALSFVTIRLKISTLDGSGVRWLTVIDFRHGQSSARLRWWLPRDDRFIILNSLKLCCWGSNEGVMHPGPNCTFFLTLHRYSQYCTQHLGSPTCTHPPNTVAVTIYGPIHAGLHTGLFISKFSKQNFECIYHCEGLQSFWREVCVCVNTRYNLLRGSGKWTSRRFREEVHNNRFRLL